MKYILKVTTFFTLALSLIVADGHSALPVVKDYGVTRVEADKIPHGEPAEGQSSANGTVSQANALTNSLLTPPFLEPKCQLPEYGNEVPFPAATIKLDIGFIPIIGKRASWLPPEPKESETSCEVNTEVCIAGIDADKDCIRDDIEYFIARKYTQQTARKYLFDYAKYLRLFLRSDLTRDAAGYYSQKMYIAAACARKELGDNPDTTKTLDSIFAEFHNTFVRSFRYIHNNGLLGGTSSQIPEEIVCDPLIKTFSGVGK